MAPFSPDGRQFMSCKEISSYLLSCCGSQDINNLESSRSGGSQQLLGKMMPENVSQVKINGIMCFFSFDNIFDQ